MPRRARLLPDRAARAHRLPRAAHQRHPRHPRLRRRPALLAESDSIVVSCPTTEGSLGDGHFPALRLPRRGRADRDRQRLERPHRPVRGGARARDARAPRAPHAPRAARRARRPLGRDRRATGRASLGLADAGTIEVDRDHPDLRGRRRQASSRSRSRRCASADRGGAAARCPSLDAWPSHRRPRAAPAPATRSRPRARAPGDAGTTCAPSSASAIAPGGAAARPDRIAIALPPGVAGLVTRAPGSPPSTASRCSTRPGLIDPNYRGEIKVMLHNAGDEPFDGRSRRPHRAAPAGAVLRRRRSRSWTRSPRPSAARPASAPRALLLGRPLPLTA